MKDKKRKINATDCRYLRLYRCEGDKGLLREMCSQHGRKSFFMGKKRIVAVLMASLIASTTLTGCSSQKKEASEFAEDYLENVLDMDFKEMGDKLRDEGSLSAYEHEGPDITVLATILDDCEEYKRTGYEKAGKNEITLDYTLTIPDYEEIKGKEYEGYEDLIDAIEALDTTEYELSITLVKKDDKWRVKDADSTIELYEDIMDCIEKADVTYPFGVEGVIETVRTYLPEVAEALDSAEVEQYGTMNALDVSEGGVQVVIEEYQTSTAAFNQFAVMVDVWCDVSVNQNIHYYYLNANDEASGILWSDRYVVHIYDCSGTHYDEVNSILDDLQEMI